MPQLLISQNQTVLVDSRTRDACIHLRTVVLPLPHLPVTAAERRRRTASVWRRVARRSAIGRRLRSQQQLAPRSATKHR